MNRTNHIDYRQVLQVCREGRVPPELKELYNHPVRNQVDWSEFPVWARPDMETENGHEG